VQRFPVYCAPPKKRVQNVEKKRRVVRARLSKEPPPRNPSRRVFRSVANEKFFHLKNFARKERRALTIGSK